MALDQSLESSRQRMMYSRCSILLRTMFSTCFALCCSAALRRPGAALIRPAEAHGKSVAAGSHQGCCCKGDPPEFVDR